MLKLKITFVKYYFEGKKQKKKNFVIKILEVHKLNSYK